MRKLKSIAESVVMVGAALGFMAAWLFVVVTIIAMYAAIPFAIAYAIYRACWKYL